ncbi:hypothetical protein HS125_06055 [bacterium]|nr:hypothetical protein [bacterium]
MFRPVNRLWSLSLVAALLLAAATAEAADPTSLSIRLVLARKTDKPDIPGSLSDVAGDIRRLGYNAATVMSSASLDAGMENTHRIAIESGFSVSVAVKPAEEGKVPVVVAWEKGGKQNKVNARVREPFISGGGAYKDGTLLLILKAR